MKTLLHISAIVAVLMFFAGCVEPTTPADPNAVSLAAGGTTTTTTAANAAPVRKDNRTSTVHCNFAREHTLPLKGEAKTYAFDTDSDQKGALAYETFCDQVAATLNAYGWRRVPGEGKQAVEKPNYWVTLVYGYALDQQASINSYKRIGAASLVSSKVSPGSEIYGKIEAYWLGINITTQPRGEGDNVFIAQIFASSDAELVLIIPTLIKQLLKDFPGENVKSQDITLQTRR